MNPNPEEIRTNAEKKYARIKKLLDEKGMKRDTETDEIIKFVVEEGVNVKGIKDLLDTDWLICAELRLFERTPSGATKQRILEHISTINGLVPQGGKGTGFVADVVLDTLNEK